MAKISYSIYYRDSKYIGDEPYFFSTKEFNWVKLLEDNWQVILNELNNFIDNSSEKLTPYFHKRLIEKGKWNTLGLQYWSVKVSENYKTFPNTAKIIKKIPNLVSASFSILDPHTNILAHQGDTNSIIRGHLGLIIPDKFSECGMKVGPEIKHWENGKVILFCDAHEHSSFNNTNQKRCIFLFDVIKPEFRKYKLTICAGVLSQLVILFLSEKTKVYRIPMWINTILHKGFQIAIIIILPVKNLFVDLKLKLYRGNTSR